MTRPVVFSDLAISDLSEIGGWVADRADADTAIAYVRRIRERCLGLGDFSHRGTPRDDLGPAIRSLAFERRIVILYRVDGDDVRILRIAHGARQSDALWLE